MVRPWPSAGDRWRATDDRGQAHTLEAFAAALLLVASVVFALEATAVTPLSASTANHHDVVQMEGVGRGVLADADRRGALRPTLVYWNDTNGTFHAPADPADGYTGGGPPTAFGAILNESLGDRGVVFNVNLRYARTDGQVGTERLVHQGTPSDDAVRVARSVTLYDGDVLRDAAGNRTGVTLENATSFYAPDAAPGDPVYNVVRVEVVLWRV